MPPATPPPPPTATPTVIPTPGPTYTPIPTLSPTPVRQATGNLTPDKRQGWVNPIVAANSPGTTINTDLSVDGQSYISWSITNTGPYTINDPFFTDLYFDDVLLERWAHDGLGVNYFSFVTGWDRLTTYVRLEAGRHTLKLVVDPTGIVPETDEDDNVFEWSFIWDPPEDPIPAAVTAIRLPDIVPFTPDGWDGPLIATSYSGDTVTGPLSVSLPTYIRFGVENQGLTSTADDFNIHIFLDDVFIGDWFSDGLLADEWVRFREWSGLLETTGVPPGIHTLKMVVDATDLVEESDEDNNVFEKEFTWGSGPVPPKPQVVAAPVPTAPAPLTLPNLVPGWRFGWDGPIIAAPTDGGLLDAPLSAGLPAYVDVVVHNRSAIDSLESFAVDLYFDGQVAHTFDFLGDMGPSSVRWWEDWDLSASVGPIAEGPHTLKIVIDLANAVEEADEDDNVFENTFVWAAGPVEEPAPVTYTQIELLQMLIDLPAVLDIQEPALSPDGVDHTDRVLRVAEAGYYLATGNSLQDERVEIFLLTHEDYLAWIDRSYADRFAVAEESQYPEILADRERIKTGSAGLKARRFGKVAVVVDAQRDVADVITALAHELGHMRQDFLGTAQSEADQFHYLNAIQEAEAQQFERVFWLALEEFTGLRYMEYPDYQGFFEIIDFRYETWLAELDEDEHSLGYLLQWLAVLDDPELAGLKAELTSAGRLDKDSSLALFDYLVGLEPEVVQAYVEDRLAALDGQLPVILKLSEARLLTGLDPAGEGRAALREPGLLMP